MQKFTLLQSPIFPGLGFASCLKGFFFFFASLFLQLHLGVNSGAQKFAIERKAVNEATFRCPDELGWQPQVRVVL